MTVSLTDHLPPPGAALDSGAALEPGADFRDGAVAALLRLRAALADLFECVPGGVRKSRDVQKHFGVDVNLSWQLFRLMGEGDVLGLTSFVPAPVPMRRLLDAARQRDVETPRVEAAAAAFEAFEAFVHSHADDRAGFESMALALSDSDEAQQADLAHRKAIFKGYSHYWGAQVDTHLTTMIVHPGQVPGTRDYAHLRGKLGLRRLRATSSPLIDMFKMVQEKPGGEADDTYRRETFDPEAATKYDAPILPRFCTQPLPPLRTVRDADGRTHTHLASDAVGRRSAVDLLFGHISRDVAPTPPDDDRCPDFSSCIRLSVPTRLVVADALFHRPSFPRLEPTLTVYGHVTGQDILQVRRGHEKLPFRDRVQHLGRGADVVRTPDVPRYAELLRFACERLGWDLDEFDVYRLRLEYPLIDTVLDLRFGPPGNAGQA